MKNNFYYAGIDLQEDFAMISYYAAGQKEPETMSTVAGSEVYQIPVLLAKRKGIGQWFFGEEAKKMAQLEQTEAVMGLVEKARKREVIRMEAEEYDARRLLGLFLKKLLLLPMQLSGMRLPDKLVLVRETLQKDEVEMFQEILPQLGLEKENFMMIDQKESFYYYLYHQSEDLWLHDVVMFDYGKGKMRYFIASKNKKTVPQLIQIEDGRAELSAQEKDTAFFCVIQNVFQKKIVSSVFLIGDGFDGNWMQRSLALLCRGRRVFVGKNLYSKGACYAASVKMKQEDWQFVYMGDSEMKLNVSLKVKRNGVPEFFTLITAGENWYEAERICEVLLEGTPEIDFWLQPPECQQAKVETLELADLPERPDGMTRLRIQAKPLSDDEVFIKIWDLGFGEIWKSSEKSWEYRMKI